MDQGFCLKWHNHLENLGHCMSAFWKDGYLTDCTIACEGKLVRAHKVVLASCSKFFDVIIRGFSSDKEPVIVLRETSYADLKAVLEFIYFGEVRVFQSQLKSLLATGEFLKVKGLAQVSPPPGTVGDADADAEPKSPDKTPDVPAAPSSAEPDAVVKSKEEGEEGAGDPEQKGELVVAEGGEEEDDNGSIKIDAMDVAPGLTIVKVEKEEDVEVSVDGDDGEPVQEDGGLFLSSVSFPEGSSPFEEEEDTPPETDEAAGGGDGPFGDVGSAGPAASSKASSVDPQVKLDSVLNEIVKMDYYVGVMGKHRSQYWMETWSRNLMELISENVLDMKNAAELVGVSYAVLYAKYRELYGYRKYPNGGGKNKGGPLGRPSTSSLRSSARIASNQPGAGGGAGTRGPRRRSAIDWGNEKVQRVCSMISARQISIKRGSDMLGIDYSTLYYHLVRNSPGKFSARRSGPGAAGDPLAVGGGVSSVVTSQPSPSSSSYDFASVTISPVPPLEKPAT